MRKHARKLKQVVKTALKKDTIMIAYGMLALVAAKNKMVGKQTLELDPKPTKDGSYYKDVTPNTDFESPY